MKKWRIHMCRVINIFVLIIMCSSLLAEDTYISPSIYDYTKYATNLTKNCTTKRQKAEVIYNWICSNIAYDTSYTIHTADECFLRRKGVCQAYCELYYHLCQAVGVQCTIIRKQTKDIHGNMNQQGHAWICAEVEEGSILIDPTWGAGSVNDNKFTYHKDHAYWFDVDPYWFIFTHYPIDSQYQLLDIPIDLQTFASLPPLHPNCQYLGWDAKELFIKWVNKEITSLPQIISIDKDNTLQLVNVPMQSQLNPACTYRFEVDNPQHRMFAIIVNDTWYHSAQWQQTGNRYWIDIMPAEGGALRLSIIDSLGYSAILSYEIQHPTLKEKEYIGAHKPPIMYPMEFESIQIVDIPKYGRLRPNVTYHFEVNNPTHFEFAIMINDTWCPSSQWQQSGSRYWIDLTPHDAGNLMLLVKQPNSDAYVVMIEYTISNS